MKEINVSELKDNMFFCFENVFVLRTLLSENTDNFSSFV